LKLSSKIWNLKFLGISGNLKILKKFFKITKNVWNFLKSFWNFIKRFWNFIKRFWNFCLKFSKNFRKFFWNFCLKFSKNFRKFFWNFLFRHFYNSDRQCEEDGVFSEEPPICRDYNECQDDPCHETAMCRNTQGSYNCICDDRNSLSTEDGSCEPMLSFLKGTAFFSFLRINRRIIYTV